MSLEHLSKTLGETIALGQISNYASWSKIGYNPAVGTTEEDLWSAGGSYGNSGLFPATAAQWEILGDENVEDIGDIIRGSRTVPVTSDAGGSTTKLVDTSEDFTAATSVAAGDLLIVDPSGTTPEWGWITSISTTTNPNDTLNFTGGLSSGGVGTTRKYLVVDASTHKGSLAIKIDYLDSTYAAATTIMPTNGTTVVQTLNDAGAALSMFRVNSFRHIGIGTEATTTNKPYGNWTLRTVGGGAGTTWSYITAGYTRARNIQYTVPLGKTLYVNTVNVGFAWVDAAKSQNQYARFWTRANREPATRFLTGNLFYPYTEILSAGGDVSIVISTPTKLAAKTDIRVSCIASAAGVATAVLRGFLTTP